MKQEIKIDGKVICVKESGGGGKIVYKHAGNMPRPIEVYAEDIETYVDCAIENFKALEDLILSSDCDQGTISWAFLLRAIRRDAEHRMKFAAILRAYEEMGGTALQTNVISADMLREAQKNPEDYENLLVRITGYNAYFTSIGKALQEEVIARTQQTL